MFPKASTLAEIDELTGIPEDVLRKVYNKGLAAWRTGHRPGANQHQWAMARIYSFVMKGCTFYNPDHLLAQEAMEKSSRARQHWQSIQNNCFKN